ncbi:hypothetical protein ES708_22058 [subsurface metagenome]
MVCSAPTAINESRTSPFSPRTEIPSLLPSRGLRHSILSVIVTFSPALTPPVMLVASKSILGVISRR